jgi:hypothetical protein
MTKQYRMGSLFIFTKYIFEFLNQGEFKLIIWIDPGMKAHPVAHCDGLDDEKEDIEYTDNEDDLGDLEYKEINAFTLRLNIIEVQNCLEVLKRGKGGNKMSWL